MYISVKLNMPKTYSYKDVKLGFKSRLVIRLPNPCFFCYNTKFLSPTSE